MCKKLLGFVTLLFVSICFFTGTYAEKEFSPQGEQYVFENEGHYGLKAMDGTEVLPAVFDGIMPVCSDYVIALKISMLVCGIHKEK